MPTLEVKPGISLAYLDSGPPDLSDEDYMTVFALHGYTFYTPFFEPAIAVSNKYGIRMVAVTRRDYPGSTLLTDEDVKAAAEGPTEKRLQTLKGRGEEILLFIDKFIDMNDIPSTSSDGGGISLMAWSMGNIHGLSALAFANDFPDLVERLAPYFRSYILYETIPLFTCPLNIYQPVQSMPPEERGPAFCDWISSHFIHPDEGLASRDYRLLNKTTPDTNKPSVYSQLTAKDRAMILDFKPPLRADLAYFTFDQAVNEGILQRAFKRQDSQSLIAWPNAPVKSLSGDQSAWSFIFGQWEWEKWIKTQQLYAQESGGWVRTSESICISGSAHFRHWEEPDIFVQSIKRLML